jgi:hypothetical protein
MKFETKRHDIIHCKNSSYNNDFDKGKTFVQNNKEQWYFNGYLIHRDDGPGIEWHTGNKEWYFEGHLHKENGPAVEYHDGKKLWFINGKEYTKETYSKVLNLKNKNRVLNEI